MTTAPELNEKALEAAYQDYRTVTGEHVDEHLEEAIQDAILTALSASGREAVAITDLWFTDSTLPMLAMSGDVEDPRTIKIHFRRPVTNQDRDDLVKAMNAYIAALASPRDAVTEDQLERAWAAIIGDGAALSAALLQAEAPRPESTWHEDDGFVVWWTWRDGKWLGEPSYIGSPLCDDWPGYHTHWTPHPAFPAALGGSQP